MGEQQKPSQHFVFARNILPRRVMQPERWTECDTLDTRQIKRIEELMPVPDELLEYESGKLGMAYGD